MLAISKAIRNPRTLKDHFDNELLYKKFVQHNLDEREKNPKKGMTGNTIVNYIHTYSNFAKYLMNTFFPMTDDVGILKQSLSDPQTSL